MPMLQKLDIREDVHSSLSGCHNARDDRIVTLSSLRQLLVRGSEQFCLWIPQHLSVPSTSRFTVDCVEDLRRPLQTFTLPHLSPTPPEIASHVTTLDSIYIHIGHGAAGTVVRGWDPSARSKFAPQSFSAGDQPRPNIDLCFYVGQRVRHADVLLTIFKSLHLHDVESLHLSAEGLYSPVRGHFVDVFAKLTALRSCVVQNAFIDPFASALDNSGGSNPCMIFPEMEELELQGHRWEQLELSFPTRKHLLAYVGGRAQLGRRMNIKVEELREGGCVVVGGTAKGYRQG